MECDRCGQPAWWLTGAHEAVCRACLTAEDKRTGTSVENDKKEQRFRRRQRHSFPSRS